MTHTHTQTCPVGAMMNIFGDNWSWLIVREAFWGATRFSEFERNTGIAKNLLSVRLANLVEQGILEKSDIGERGTRFEYTLTASGRALQPVMIAMMQWGNAHIYGKGNEPILMRDRQSGETITDMTLIAADGRVLDVSDVRFEIGPGADESICNRLKSAKRKNKTAHQSQR